MFTQVITINNEVGLHARPATFFIQRANEFKSQSGDEGKRIAFWDGAPWREYQNAVHAVEFCDRGEIEHLPFFCKGGSLYDDRGKSRLSEGPYRGHGS